MTVCCSLIVCNLYPFSQTVAVGDVAVDDAVEQIDIGICTFQALLLCCLLCVTTYFVLPQRQAASENVRDDHCFGVG